MYIKCRNCGTDFDSNYCPNCGAPARISEPQNQAPSTPPQFQPPPINPIWKSFDRPKKMNGCLLAFIIAATAFGGLFILIILVSFFSFNNNKSENSQKTASTSKTQIEAAATPSHKPTEVPVIKITSSELIDTFNANSVKCKSLYDKQHMEVTGTVQSVGEDIFGNIYVCLGHDTEFTFVGIQCYAEDKNTEAKIAELLEGDVITVRGTGESGSLSFSLKKAAIVD